MNQKNNRVINFLSLRHNTNSNLLSNLMPYTLRKQSRRGYKVCKKGTRKCFSKRALTKRMAVRQMRALYLSESRSNKMGSNKMGSNKKQRGG